MEHNQKLEAMRREYLNERQELSIRLVSAVQNQEVKPDSSVTDSSAKPAKPPPPPPSHHDTITGKPFFSTSLLSQLTWPLISNQKKEKRLIILFCQQLRVLQPWLPLPRPNRQQLRPSKQPRRQLLLQAVSSSKPVLLWPTGTAFLGLRSPR